MADEIVSLDGFRAIPGVEGYMVDDCGNVVTCVKQGMPGKGGRFWNKWRRVKLHREKSGHLCLTVKEKGMPTRFIKAHHLVLWAFVGPAPAKHECRHLNGKPADNRLNNLKWGTRRENVQDAIEHGTFVTARPRNFSPEEYAAIENEIRLGILGVSALARKMNVPYWLVNYIKNRRMKERVA